MHPPYAAQADHVDRRKKWAQVANFQRAAADSRPRRRGDRIKTLFAAVHESAIGKSNSYRRMSAIDDAAIEAKTTDDRGNEGRIGKK
jgi:hypothetical protein